jgi:hypothetical protein
MMDYKYKLTEEQLVPIIIWAIEGVILDIKSPDMQYHIEQTYSGYTYNWLQTLDKVSFDIEPLIPGSEQYSIQMKIHIDDMISVPFVMGGCKLVKSTGLIRSIKPSLQKEYCSTYSEISRKILLELFNELYETHSNIMDTYVITPHHDDRMLGSHTIQHIDDVGKIDKQAIGSILKKYSATLTSAGVTIPHVNKLVNILA